MGITAMVWMKVSILQMSRRHGGSFPAARHGEQRWNGRSRGGGGISAARTGRERGGETGDERTGVEDEARRAGNEHGGGRGRGWTLRRGEDAGCCTRVMNKLE
jgi:hypothetical protein